MKLTKKLQAEILKVYNTYWDAYLKGDMKTFASMLADDISVFGTAVSEVFNNKRETLRFYKATADQLVGKAQFRNRKYKMHVVDNNVLVNQQSDLYFLMDKKWTYYGHIRVSAIFKQIGSGWKLAHQHASFPDTRADEGEQVNTDKIKAENIQLRDAVKRRTIELEEKNRELEIETALEKVRSVAMGMKEASDMPGICKTIAAQLEILGLKEIRNVQTAVFNRSTTVYKNYEYFPLDDKSIIIEVDYTLQPDVKAFAKRMMKASGTFYTKSFNRKELREWGRYQQKANQYRDLRQQTANGLHYYFFSIENAALGISIFTELNKEEINVFKKFRNVFELAYKRFIDIQKAEAQAREAQIEAALERVRSKTNAMNRSEDLHKVIREVHDQLRLLEFRFDGVDFMTDYSDKGFNIWLAAQQHTFSAPINVPAFGHKIFRTLKKAKKEGRDFFTFTLDREEKNKYIKHLVENTIVKDVSEEMKQHILAAKGWATSCVVLENIILSITNLELIPYTDAENAIIKRFAHVFQQSYTRFLDLQTSEAQTREAKIETSLERVRAKTMAMHKSSDLLDVVKVLGEQFELLGFKFQSVNFDTDFQEKDWNLWLYNSGSAMYPGKIHIPYIDHPCFNRPLEAFKKGGDLHSFIFTKEEKDSLFDHIYANSVAKYGSDERKRFTYAAPGFALSIAVTKNTRITIANYNAEPFSEEENAILRRFANVFEQSYTRFLDLQKAEAQAKEALTEAALEKVRSRSLAMHKSDELNQVIVVVLKKLQELGISMGNRSAAIFTFKPGTKDYYQWAASPEISSAFSLLTPYIDHPVQNDIWNARESKVDFLTRSYSREEKNSFFHYLFEHTELKQMPRKEKDWALAQENYDVAIAFEKNSAVVIVSHSGVLLSEEENTILKRFSRVFEQSYIRFLDLQKAEAQAREAQIQLALERVRARTMAMHHSDELTDVVKLLYQEFDKLKISNESTDIEIGLINEETGIASVWAHFYLSDGTISTFKLPLTYVEEINNEFNIWKATPVEKRNELFLTTVFTGDLSEKFMRITEDFPDLAEIFRPLIEAKIEKWVTHNAYFSHGFLTLQGIEAYSTETQEIQKRFAKVFEQTYTRFLDLQKAEAQAREAQIEAALERVRSRTMAMQKTDELLDAAQLVHKELAALGINSMNVSYAFVDQEEKYGSYYSINPIDGRILPIPFVFPHTETEVMRSILASWKKQETYNVIELKEKATIKHQTYIGEHIQRQLAKNNVPFSIEEFLNVSPKKAALSTFNFANGYLFNIGEERLSKIQEELMLRFTRVFEQTYTRFLDLQKAEAQAREAQIEASLERVRSRTMGMQKSDELKEVIQVVYDQFVHLNIHVEHTGFIMDYKKRDDMHIWLADKHAVPFQVTIPYFDCAHWNSFNEAKEKGIDFFANQLSFEEKNKFYQDLFKVIPGIPEETLEYYFSCPGLAISTVLLENVGLYIENFSGTPYTAEENNTLLRFGKVFQQTYTRFLDLQKAEAQARESEIELGLERVRAKTMAMQKPSEFLEVINVIGEQFINLGFDIEWVNFGANGLDIAEGIDIWNFAIIPGGNPVSARIFIPYFDHPLFIKAVEKLNEYRRTGNDFFIMAFDKNDKDRWLDHLFTKTVFKEVPEEYRAIQYAKPGYTTSNISLKDTWLSIGKFDPRSFTDEQHAILRKFANAFGQAYTRFLDLQKAEAQAREAQIEVAVERVRAKALAMHKSEEIISVIKSLHKELDSLKIAGVMAATIYLKQEDGRIRFWDLTALGENEDEAHFTMDQFLPLEVAPSYLWFQKMLNSKEKYFTVIQNEKDLELSMEWIRKFINTEVAESTIEFLKVNNYKMMWHPTIRLDSGLLNIDFVQPPPAEIESILLKLGAAFDLAYKRFLDLKNAEAQTRESQIELGLERVRARAMAMQNSDELKELIGTVFTELTKLDLVLTRCVIMIYDGLENTSRWWMANSEDPNNPAGFFIKQHEQPPMVAYFKAWRERKIKYTYALQGKIKQDWDDFLFSETELKNLPGFVIEGMKAPDLVYLNASFNNFGNLTLASLEPLSDEHFDILLRFAKVFDLTYTRFNDLKQAEAQAREAQIETALERVRSRTLAMHKSEELAETAVVLFKQMIGLGIEPNRLYIAIINDDSGDLEFWITDENGEKVSSRYMVNIHKNISIKKMYEGWASRRKTITIDMQGKELEDWLLYWKEEFHVPFKPGAALKRRVQNIAYFSKGFVAIASPDDQPELTINLLERFAAVFNLTYTRFNDLKIAEAHAFQAEEDLQKLHTEKRRTEEALAVLQATQKQLIQSEKMASLGELTAGIAHEIQNPLNFVNNFSEVSNELIEELKIKNEKLKIDDEEVNELLNDIAQNLEKINHHGKRADGIVKGMLQHSRTSSGQKEPTDINVLAEEYLRLAYHGLRAKDKSFNAKFETDFDPAIDKIDLVQQDIGRVILNLINNAFYAVDEKKKQVQNGYEPVVTINTKKLGDTIEIGVKDNGNGIPKKVLDKIFQPFFTTKPTGQGTGLGLSLAYDIIKTHGGELKVDTVEGKGANFIISIPIIDRR